MKYRIASLALLLSTCAGASVGQAHEPCFARSVSVGRVVYRSVQTTPTYRLRRAEVTTGARLTLFANFLRAEPGIVMLDVNGATLPCKIVQWKGDSVTVQLPMLGMNRPLDAQIRVILPTGQVAEAFQVVLVSQPRFVEHRETIPQPQPPTAAASSALYAQPINGGATLNW